ncbi:MAG: hypothetical protein ABSC47_03645 [Terracidiphilus sp.]|jgi:hypothetical protein
MAFPFLPALSIVRQIAVSCPDASLLRIFGPKVNLAAASLFHIIACLQEHEEVRLQVVAQGYLER